MHLRNQTLIGPKEYKKVEINSKVAYHSYMVAPLLTSFAYVLFYTKEGKQGVVHYHANCGMLDNLIIAKIKNELPGAKFNNAIIAIPDDLSIKLALEQKKKLAQSFDFESDQVVIKKNVSWYTVDNRGNHGALLNEDKIRLLEIHAPKITFIDNLISSLNQTSFQRKNWLGDVVAGDPKGVKEIKLLLANWDNDKTIPKNVLMIFNAVHHAIQAAMQRDKRQRLLETQTFYADQLQKVQIDNFAQQHEIRL